MHQIGGAEWRPEQVLLSVSVFIIPKGWFIIVVVIPVQFGGTFRVFAVVGSQISCLSAVQFFSSQKTLLSVPDFFPMCFRFHPRGTFRFAKKEFYISAEHRDSIK